MRSEAQKLAFALNCREIEKEGGDVLGFIEVNWPSYTPRATWYNLQRKYLHRQQHQFSEGKAIDPETERMMKLKTDKSAQLDAVLKIIDRKEDPVEYLAALGYKCPEQAWADLKVWARKNRPEDREKLPGDLRKYYAECGIKKDALKTGPQPMTIKTDGGTLHNENRNPPSPQMKKVGADMEKAAEAIGKMGETIKEAGRQLEKAIALPVCGVRSRCRKDGKFEICPVKSEDGGFMSFVWRDLITHDERALIMSTDEWRKFADEIPQALKQLGL